jgi:hypothetical protein
MANPASAEQIANLKIGGREIRSDEWIAKIGDAIAKNLSGVMEKFGVDLADEFARLAPVSSGSLADSISVLGVTQKEDGLYRLEIGFGVDYADYIDKGVEGIAPSKSKKILQNREGRKYKFKTYGMPEDAIQGLKDWARAKNIKLKAEAAIKHSQKKRKGKYKEPKPKLRETDSGARSLAYLIKKNGIAARDYQGNAFRNIAPKYEAELETIGLNSFVFKIVS